MTKQEFQKRMALIKRDLESGKLNDTLNRLGVCYLIRRRIADFTEDYFAETYSPFPDFIYNEKNLSFFMGYSKKGERLTDVEAFENRVYALLLFEQQALNYKLYLKWK